MPPSSNIVPSALPPCTPRPLPTHLPYRIPRSALRPLLPLPLPHDLTHKPPPVTICDHEEWQETVSQGLCVPSGVP